MLYKGIVVEVTTLNILAQNRGSEKARHYIIMQARLIAIDANLLYNLWLKVYKTAIYLGNITPKKSLS
jgi:hypothetical protein